MATIKLTGLNTSTGRSTTAGDTDVVDLDGSLTIGNADTDAVVFNAEIDSDFIPDDTNTYDIGSASKLWAQGHFYDLNVYNSIIVESSVTNAELIRLQKNDPDTRFFVFESGGVDKFEMYLNSFENFTFTTTDSTDDILFKLNGHTAIYMNGYPKEVRIWDSYNSGYNTQVNSSLDINGTATTEAIIPKTDATYDLGDAATNVWNNVFAVKGNFADANITSGILQQYSYNTGATGTVSRDCDNGHVFLEDSLNGTFTYDLLNLGLSNGNLTTIQSIIIQSASARMLDGLKIGGSGQTIIWEGGSAPSGTANGVDVVTLTIIRLGDGSYNILGSAISYS